MEGSGFFNVKMKQEKLGSGAEVLMVSFKSFSWFFSN